MPRVTRLSKRFRGWNETTVFVLRTGLDYFDEFKDDAEVQQAWQDLRREILPEFIAENPGFRPHAWWRYDCPANQFRTRTDGKLHPFFDPSFDMPKELSFGIPRYFRECDIPTGGVLDIAKSFETEAQFLKRLNLCSAAELKALSGKTER